MNNKKLIALSELIEEEYSNITGMIIMKNNQVIYENYFNGYNLNNTIHIASVTKSILSILIGIAIDEGHIKSLKQKVLEFFPKYQIKRGEKTIQNITIQNLLTMTSPYKYKSEPYTKVYSSDDWTKAVLDLLGGKGKIGEFKYTTIGIQVLSGILVNATGQSVFDYAKENLFTPLGIKVSNNKRIHTKNEHFSFLQESTDSCWIIDPKGVNTAGWGLTLNTQDMLKIGQLYLNKGVWESGQIVSSNWVEKSTKQHSTWGELAYGYLWWIIGEKDNSSFAALGDGGNVIYVSPKQELVVAITSKFLPRAKDRIEFIKRYIEPIF